MIRLIWGITPEHWTLRTNTSPYAPSETTPSWIRAPPESLMPMTGQPILAARSITLHIFSLITSPSEPPKTVKSWLNTHTRRPSIVPWPVTTASPQGRDLSISNSCVRWRTYVSSSWKEPGSSSFSIRSRAVYLPFACCFSTAFSEAWWIAAPRSSSSRASFSSLVSRAFSRIARAVYVRRGRTDGDIAGEPKRRIGLLLRVRLSKEVLERAEIEVELLVGEAEVLLQLLHPLLQRDQGLAESLDLVVAEAACLDPPYRLAFHQLPQQFDEREHELGEPTCDVLSIALDPHRRSTAAKLYGGHGPVTRTRSRSWPATSSSAHLRKSGTRLTSTR